METAIRARVKIPDWVRRLALLWLAVWFPVYWRAWGAGNFLHLCDVAVILTCIGLWTGNALLVASQAVSSVLIDALWTLDVAAWLFFRRHFIGGTEYLFDATIPLWVRLLSLFHIMMPFILLWSLSRMGYDRRGFALQAAIALPVVIASRFVTPDAEFEFRTDRAIFSSAAWAGACAFGDYVSGRRLGRVFAYAFGFPAVVRSGGRTRWRGQRETGYVAAVFGPPSVVPLDRWRTEVRRYKSRVGRDCAALFGLADGAEVNAELLAFFVEVAAFQAEGFRGVGHVMMMAALVRRAGFRARRLPRAGRAGQFPIRWRMWTRADWLKQRRAARLW